MMRAIGRFLRGLAFALVCLLCTAIGGCTAWLQYHHFVRNADFRAKETREAIAEVRQFGEEAESIYRKIGRVPSMEDLNCESKPCSPYKFITRWVWVDRHGTVYAKLQKLGVMFTPASQFQVEWNSKSRTTDLDSKTEPRHWRMRFLLWLAVDVLIILVILWRLIERFSNRKAEEFD